MDKKILDDILNKHRAQPVGNGYIDIIVLRDSYREFIFDLFTNGSKIKSISWWEWCPGDEKNIYGLGGPKSKYFKGWFSELPIDIDDLNLSIDKSKEDLVKEIINTIESKTIYYPSETITFKDNKWLTPAFWLDVPEKWRNNQSFNN